MTSVCIQSTTFKLFFPIFMISEFSKKYNGKHRLALAFMKVTAAAYAAPSSVEMYHKYGSTTAVRSLLVGAGFTSRITHPGRVLKQTDGSRTLSNNDPYHRHDIRQPTSQRLENPPAPKFKFRPLRKPGFYPCHHDYIRKPIGSKH